MNTYTFKIGFKVNDIISAVHCPLEGFLVSVDKTPEIKEVNERKQLNVYVEDYMCSDKDYALSSKFVCKVSDILDFLAPVGDEKDDERYIRAAKAFIQCIPYVSSGDLPVTMEVLDE
nr:MAG TPA: hypothetical protein [Microviridae sp.]